MHRMATAVQTTVNRQTEIMVDDGHKTHINSNSNPGLNARGFHLFRKGRIFVAERTKDKHSASENTIRKGRSQNTTGLLQHLFLNYDA